MRLLHSSDWHLGRLFHGIHLTDDQAIILDQFIDIAKEFSPDAIIIAGDIYDRSVPPPEAINLLDEVLSKLLLDVKIPIFIIAGNHDGPDRLGFASRLLQKQGLYIFSYPELHLKPVTLQDKFGPVDIFPIPFARPERVRSLIDEPEIKNHQQAMSALMDRVDFSENKRRVAISHSFVTGGSTTESETPLSVGGSEMISVDNFDNFSYVALGHLHKVQSFRDDKIHYSGSLMKYSFSEVNHQKSVSLVELDEHGNTKIERIPLVPKRDLRCLKGTLDEIVQHSGDDAAKDDYLMVTLTDSEPIFDAMGKLRQVYPNVMHIERPIYSVNPREIGLSQKQRKMNDSDLFESFYKQIMPSDISPAQKEFFAKIADSLMQEQREA